ncbi:MAG: ABC transporter substrate-binding protein [Nocardioidaceae bacterium]|nr:ABC transporter substrate-binding protein [Nocardioidaceae bacterium]
MFRNRAVTAVLAASSILGFAACGGDDSGGGDTSGGDGGTAAGSDQPWILGTTDTVTALDPAGSYDLGSWTLSYNLYQTLLTIPAGENVPQPDAAESCQYDDPQTFTCTLNAGLTFSNGSELTSSDVKYSIERNLAIEDPNGASGLLASVDSVDTPDDTTVTFNLSRPDTTFQFVLTTATASIVDEDTFPADALLPDEQVVGSGPFMLDQYKAGEQAVLTANPKYQGANEALSPQVFVQYYAESSALKLAAQENEIDVAWRSLSPPEINDLKSQDSVEVIEGEGAEIRYFVWQFNTDIGKDPAVRKAVAQIIDREAIAERAYDGTVEPLYSIVPPGLPGQVDSFQEVFGEPSAEAATQTLEQAGVQTPVALTLGYTPSHYGPNAVDEASELADQLNATGLFDVTLKDAEWEEYQTLYKENAYDLFHLGWFPDFLDADNYLSPFVVDGGFFANGYSSKKANKLVAAEQAASEPSKREATFEELQALVAQDVPLIPSWVGINTAVAGPGMEGVAETLDPAFIFRFWTVSKSE